MNFSISIRSRSMAFYETLIQTLPPRTVSDRTCFRRIASWLGAGVESGHFKEEIFQEVLLFAQEARCAACRNPNAVFVSILKKELKYDPRNVTRQG